MDSQVEALETDSEDEKAFLQTIIQIAATMDRLKIGTERSRFIAKTFQGWLDKGIIKAAHGW